MTTCKPISLGVRQITANYGRKYDFWQSSSIDDLTYVRTWTRSSTADKPMPKYIFAADNSFCVHFLPWKHSKISQSRKFKFVTCHIYHRKLNVTWQFESFMNHVIWSTSMPVSAPHSTTQSSNSCEQTMGYTSMISFKAAIAFKMGLDPDTHWLVLEPN